MKKMAIIAFGCVFLSVVGAPPAIGDVAPTPEPTATVHESSGLQLSVRDESVAAGEAIGLHWEIVPDGPRSVSIILGIILPDGSVRYYGGVKEGFTGIDDIGQAKAVVTDFPFNTRMSGALSIKIPADWPEGTYQFMAHVFEGQTCLEIVYSDAFDVE